MRSSVSIHAAGDREVTLEEVVDLADAVAKLDGIASGYGTMRYGAPIVVEADISDIAAEIALEKFAQAVAKTSLPEWPITNVETLAEDDDLGDLESELP